MTLEQFQAALSQREAFRKLAQDLKARNDQLLAGAPSVEDLTKVADHLIATQVLDAGQKDAAVGVLADHKKALDTLVNLASLVRETAVGPDGSPGRPIKTAGVGAAPADGPPKAHDWTDDPEFQEMTSEIIKLAANAATV